MEYWKENLIVAAALIEQANDLLLKSRVAEHIPGAKAIGNLQARLSNLVGLSRETKAKVLNERPPAPAAPVTV